MTPDLMDRLVAKFTVGDGCWEWTGARNNTGYSVFRADGRNVTAHRFVYEWLVGPAPEDLDHLCRNRACVRPDHLEPVSRRENLLRGGTLTAQNAAKTHCPQGHPLVEPNLCGGMRGRKCKTCKNKAERERQKRLRAA